MNPNVKLLQRYIWGLAVEYYDHYNKKRTVEEIQGYCERAVEESFQYLTKKHYALTGALSDFECHCALECAKVFGQNFEKMK
jgi:hypothetical protein